MTRFHAFGAYISWLILIPLWIHRAQASLSCPEDDQTIYYNADGQAYLLDCTADYPMNDLGVNFPTYNWENCTLVCSTTPSCTAFVFSAPGPDADCFLKSAISSTSRTNSNLWGGILLGSNATISSSVVSAASAVSASSQADAIASLSSQSVVSASSVS